MNVRSATPILLQALLGGALVAVVFAVISPSGPTTTRTIPASTAPSANALASDTQSHETLAHLVYAHAAPGVVAISATSAVDGFTAATQRSTGSGIVVNAAGLILTNEHVVDGASSVTVQFGGSGGATRAAHVVGVDASNDLALLAVRPAGLRLTALGFADSSTVNVGDPAFAIGNPYSFDQTLTVGVISALDRSITAPNGATITGVIQTDSALNPGNSGGPLLNAAGEVIGVNSQIAAGGSDTSVVGGGNSGVGFAVASNTVTADLATLDHGAALAR